MAYVSSMNQLVYITAPDSELADKIAAKLVEARLAAGAHLVGPVRSVYRWEGQIHHKEEWVVLAQIPREAFAKVEEMVLAMHPYIVPCILGIDIDNGHQPFLDWIEKAGE